MRHAAEYQGPSVDCQSHLRRRQQKRMGLGVEVAPVLELRVSAMCATEEVTVSGHKQRKKDRHRTEKEERARKRDFEQPIVGAVKPQRAQDTSNLTDGEIAGKDWKEDARGVRNR
jgi:hypothetical protein